MAGKSDTLRSPTPSSEGRRRIMVSIRGKDTRPERLLRSTLWELGLRGWRCHWAGPGGRVDIAFTRWRLAVFVDGSFWHGHPSKWQPGRWTGYWDEKIKRNRARDARQSDELGAEGWKVLRFWDFEVEEHPFAVAEQVRAELEERRVAPEKEIVVT